MKVILIILCLLFCNSPGIAQRLRVERRITGHSVYVKGNGFEGVIFDKSYKNKLLDGFDDLKRFTPNTADIMKAEGLLKRKLSDLANKYNQQYVEKNLKKYIRQYVGIVNAKGEREIFINFLWKESLDVSDIAKIDPKTDLYYWQKDWVTVADGGNHFWQIKINLKTGELSEFGVNGEA